MVSLRLRTRAARLAFRPAPAPGQPLPAVGCAYSECLSPGRDGEVVPVPGEFGTTWFTFCSSGHREAWLEDGGITRS